MEFKESGLGREYLKLCKLRNNANNTGKLNLSDINWFYPTSLLPLGIFIKEEQEISVVPPSDPDVLSYYNIITESRSEYSTERTYLPIVQIPPSEHQRAKILEPVIYANSDKIGGVNAFAYFVGEIVDNVYQHSKFSTAYIMAQKYPAKRFTEVSIVDGGISIPGAFENAGFEFEDTEALSKAINGLSTKRDKERGFGLGSSIKLLTKGLCGECLIVSREGGLIMDNEKKTLYKMDSNCMFKGTLVSVRVPFQDREVEIYDYIE